MQMKKKNVIFRLENFFKSQFPTSSCYRRALETQKVVQFYYKPSKKTLSGFSSSPFASKMADLDHAAVSNFINFLLDNRTLIEKFL